MQPRVASQFINVIQKRIFSKIEEHFLTGFFHLKSAILLFQVKRDVL